MRIITYGLCVIEVPIHLQTQSNVRRFGPYVYVVRACKWALLEGMVSKALQVPAVFDWYMIRYMKAHSLLTNSSMD
jgi:hypothetical protein